MASPRRILIIRPSALGDVARTVPTLVSLKRAYPDAAIDWLVNDAFADVIAHHPDLSQVVPFPRKELGRNAAKAIGYMAQLRRLRYDVVYDLQGLARSGWLTWSTRASRRVGPADAREAAWLAYTDRIAISPDCVHTVDRMLAVLEGDDIPIVRDMRLHLGGADRNWLDTWLAQRGVPAERYAVIAPTARWLSKRWPIERYIEVVRRLPTLGLRHAVIVAAGSEREQVEPLLREPNLGVQVLDMVGATSVGQLMALLSGAGLVLANDSAALHIAIGFARRSVAIFGPTDPATVGPYRYDTGLVAAPAERRIHYRDVHDQSIIAQVTTDQVWQAAERVMASPPPTVIHP